MSNRTTHTRIFIVDCAKADNERKKLEEDLSKVTGKSIKVTMPKFFKILIDPEFNNYNRENVIKFFGRKRMKK